MNKKDIKAIEEMMKEYIDMRFDQLFAPPNYYTMYYPDKDPLVIKVKDIVKRQRKLGDD